MTRVAVIDPGRDVLDLYTELFEDLGYEVDTHTGALPGVEQLVASRPDLILVDVELDPVREQLTGLQVVHSVRSGTALRDVPIIVSATATEHIAAALSDTMERGDVHRLEKPFDLTTFERVVQAALGLSHGLADAPDSGTIPADEDRNKQQRAP